MNKRDYQSSFLSTRLLKVVKYFGDNAPLMITAIGILLRLIIILASFSSFITDPHGKFSRYDLQHIEHWSAQFRTRSFREILSSYAHSGVRVPGSLSNSEITSPFKPLLPFQTYFYYMTSLLSHFSFLVLYQDKMPDTEHLAPPELLMIWT